MAFTFNVVIILNAYRFIYEYFGKFTPSFKMKLWIENRETHYVKCENEMVCCAWFSLEFRKCFAPTYPSNDFRKEEFWMKTKTESPKHMVYVLKKYWRERIFFRSGSSSSMSNWESKRNVGYLNSVLLPMHFLLLFSFRLGTSCYFSRISFDRNSISEVNWGISHICDWDLESYIPSVRSI